MRVSTRTSCIAAGGLLILVCACGSVDAPSHSGEPLWTFQGRIVESEPGLEVSSLRAAILWESRDQRWIVGNDVPVSLSGRLPVSFQIDFFEPPPSEVMWSSREVGEAYEASSDWADDAFKLAEGILVIYDDVNGSGGIDLLPDGADVEIDRFLGPLDKFIEIGYIEGDPTPLNEANAQENGCADQECFNGECRCVPDEDGNIEMIETGILSPGFNIVFDAEDEELQPFIEPLVVDVVIGYDPDFQGMMCESVSETKDVLIVKENTTLESVPADAEIFCMEDGRSFHYQKTERLRFVEGELCSVEEWESEVGSVVLDTESPPSDWPCEHL